MSSSATDEQMLQTAKKIAQEAARVVIDLRKNPIIQNKKADKSIVTEADLQADRILREGLLSAFPDHGILTEEHGLSGNPDSEFVWVVDPLDGTKAYAKGIPGFSVMVGLLKNEEPYLGVVIDPLEGFVYEAVRGQGAFLTSGGQRQRLHVSDRNAFDKMPIVVSPGFSEEALQKIVQKLRCPVVPPINSVGIKVGLVIRQVADIYVSHHSVHYWDTCAPEIILKEAGGRLTRLDGTPFAYSLAAETGYSHEGLPLATNGCRHKEIGYKIYQFLFIN